MDAVRLGDILDDHCTRCHLLTNHSVVALVGDAVKKVRCRTCNHEHDYRHGKEPQKKKTKLSPYEEVLASIMAGRPGAPAGEPAEAKKPSAPPASRRTRPLSLRSRLLPKH